MSDRCQDLQEDVEFHQIFTSLSPVKISISGDTTSSLRVYGDGSSRYEEAQQCRTPTSKENKLAVKLECPPAPKKALAPRREKSISGKRKSLQNEEEFLKVVDRKEVEAFFRVLEGTGSSLSSCPVGKRRRIRAGL